MHGALNRPSRGRFAARAGCRAPQLEQKTASNITVAPQLTQYSVVRGRGVVRGFFP